ncbi:MAG TPA: glycosyltransferase family 1 protein [Chloroflexota bacterium]|nr:glycosyltransferase family 1 protein [Chloroflexota bacterium]
MPTICTSFELASRAGMIKLSSPALPPHRRSLVLFGSPLASTMVKIALNALLLSRSASYRSAGISQYIYELLRNLRLRPPEQLYEAFVTADPGDIALSPTPNFHCTSVGPLFGKPSMRVLWEQLVQPLTLTRRPPDVLHALGYALPLAWRGRTVITICDVSFARYPGLFNRSNAIYLSTIARLSARKASMVLTISESTRRDVIQLFGVSPERVTTSYCGVSDRFQPASDSEIEALRARAQLPRSFLLYLGTIEPRKNVAGLVRAYARYRQEVTDPVTLVLAGGRGWKDRQVFDLVDRLGLRDCIRFPGYVPSEDLPAWYSAATAFVYPSRYEGFGLPVAEAMACGTPVITTTSSSLPEVVGDAGLLVGPDDEAALSSAIARVASDSELRRTLSLAGRKRVARFRWEHTAAETAGAYERLINSPRGYSGE